MNDNDPDLRDRPLPRPRRGKVAAWSLALAGLAAIAGAVAIGYPALVEWWYGIPVVRTWRDLLDQEPIDLGNGITVRLGIEAKRAPLWSGVLVYCLAEGYQGGSGELVGQLGPLELVVYEEGGEDLRGLRSAPEFLHKALFGGNSPFLFAQSIPVTSPRARQVELRHRGRQVWRRTTVRTSQEAFHPWMPLALSKNLRPLVEESGDAVPFVGAVTNRADGIALPLFEGWRPYALQSTRECLASPDLLLPSLLPHFGDSRLSLRPTGKGFELELRVEEALTVWWPTGQFLARFWINDKPFPPQPVKPSIEEQSWHGPPPEPANRLRLELELDSTKLGARPGDRIGVQLLYAEGDWEYIAPGHESLRGERICRLTTEDGDRVLETNRIELIAP